MAVQSIEGDNYVPEYKETPETRGRTVATPQLYTGHFEDATVNYEDLLLNAFMAFGASSKDRAGAWAKILEARSASTNYFTDVANIFTNLAETVEAPGDTVEVPDDFVWPPYTRELLAMEDSTGQPGMVPDWLGVRNPTKEEALSVATTINGKADMSKTIENIVYTKLSSAANDIEIADRYIATLQDKFYNTKVHINGKS